MYLILIDQYGRDDVGLIFVFLFNIIRLKKGEAMISTPDDPHAYLSGDLVECMCNSDNTVRGGLTPKFKDTEILYDMLPYQNMELERKAIQGKTLVETQSGSTVVEYKSGFSEFRLHKVEVKPSLISELGGPHSEEIKLRFSTYSMAVVVQGKGTVTLQSVNENEEEE